MFLTVERYGRIKARAYANGSKQKEYIKKEDVASSMVYLDSIFIT